MSTQENLLRNISVNPLTLGAGLTVLVGLSLFSLGLAALRWESRNNRDDSALPAFGTLKLTQSSVRKKAPNRLDWRAIESGEKVRFQDSIHTGPGEGATLVIDDSGAEIELGPDTLVVLKKSENLPLQFVSGNAIIREKDGVDQKIEITADGKPKITALPIKLLSPSHHQGFLTARSESTATLSQREIEFRWAIPAGSGDSETPPPPESLEIAKNRNFAPILEKVSLKADQFSATVKLTPGTYFWRIRTQTSSAPEIRTFSLTPIPLHQITSPAPDEVLPIWGETNPVSFRLRAIGESDGDERLRKQEVVLELTSEDSQLPPLLVPVNSLNQSFLSPPLVPGKWSARLRSKFSDQTEAGTLESISPVTRFDLTQKTRIDSRWITPTPGQSFEKGQNVRLQWRVEAPPPSGAQSLLTLRENGRIIKTAPLSSGLESFTFEGLDAGLYDIQWTTELAGKKIAETDRLTFRVFQGKPLTLLEPSPNSQILYWPSPTAITLRWKTDSFVSENPDAKYAVEVSLDPEFTSPMLKETTSQTEWITNASLLKEGLYHWRISVLDPEGQILKSSGVSKFSLAPRPLLAAPKADQIRPRFNETLDYRANQGRFKLSWTPITGAVAYRIQVLEARSGKILHEDQTPQTQYTLDHLQEGEFIWSLSALDSFGRVGLPLEAQKFQVSYGAKLPSPKVAELLIGKGKATSKPDLSPDSAGHSSSLRAPKILSSEVQ